MTNPITRIIEENPGLDHVALMNKICEELPECRNWTLDEMLAWLKASVEDIQREEIEEARAKGEPHPEDMALFLRIQEAASKRLGPDLTLGEAMEDLRRKPRRGHLQAKALEIWDRCYASGDFELEV